jgi:hypothetical protein
LNALRGKVRFWGLDKQKGGSRTHCAAAASISLDRAVSAILKDVPGWCAEMMKATCSLMAARLLGFVGGIIRTLTILHREKAIIQQEVRATTI